MDASEFTKLFRIEGDKLLVEKLRGYVDKEMVRLCKQWYEEGEMDGGLMAAWMEPSMELHRMLDALEGMIVEHGALFKE